MVVHVYNIKVIQEHNLFINTDTAMLLQEFQTNLFAPVRVSMSHKSVEIDRKPANAQLSALLGNVAYFFVVC